MLEIGSPHPVPILLHRGNRHWSHEHPHLKVIIPVSRRAQNAHHDHILLFLFTFVVGCFIGGTGIGYALFLVPYLVFILGMEAPLAVASTMFAYLFSGATATIAYARHGSIRWPMAWSVCGDGTGRLSGLNRCMDCAGRASARRYRRTDNPPVSERSA